MLRGDVQLGGLLPLHPHDDGLRYPPHRMGKANKAFRKKGCKTKMRPVDKYALHNPSASESIINKDENFFAQVAAPILAVLGCFCFCCSQTDWSTYFVVILLVRMFCCNN